MKKNYVMAGAFLLLAVRLVELARGGALTGSATDAMGGLLLYGFVGGVGGYILWFLQHLVRGRVGNKPVGTTGARRLR